MDAGKNNIIPGHLEHVNILHMEPTHAQALQAAYSLLNEDRPLHRRGIVISVDILERQ